MADRASLIVPRVTQVWLVQCAVGGVGVLISLQSFLTLFVAGSNCDLSDIPLCQNIAWGHFMAGIVDESRLMCSRCKNSLSCRHFYFGAPHAPSKKLSLASWQRPGGMVPWSQDVIVFKHNCLAWISGGQPDKCLPSSLWMPFFYCSARERISSWKIWREGFWLIEKKIFFCLCLHFNWMNVQILLA